MANANNGVEGIISLPKGGGELSGIGEKFSPDLFTGTGNFTVPIALPPGRNGFQPELNLVYSTGNGNGPFGLGWNLSVPGITRKTSKGVPRYRDYAEELKDRDTFILSGAEDLVPVEPGKTTYRPRTEGLFARILHHHSKGENYWEVRSKDGLVSYYGTPRPKNAAHGWQDPAVIADPRDRRKIFAWKLTRTEDPFHNKILYEYERDLRLGTDHQWDQIYLKRIRYVDYHDDDGKERYLVSVTFDYGQTDNPCIATEDACDRPETLRPDPFSEYRPGFEVRTRCRSKGIVVATHADECRVVRRYEFNYLDERDSLPELRQSLPLNGVSLLSQIRVVGCDGDRVDALPPLEFGYTCFEPTQRDFTPLGGDLPARSLADPNLELVDLFGNGLPDILEMNGAVHYWRNLGNARFNLSRSMVEAPAGFALAQEGVQIIDADGDGRADLMVTTPGLSGFFPTRFGGLWDRRSFRAYETAPSFNLEDPEVRLVDLTGDGVTDAVRSGTRLECFFNDPHEGWIGTRPVERRQLDHFPNINFSDPRVKWADMSGDGLQDIVLVHDGNVEYWPNLGYGNWAPRVTMRNAPRFSYGYRPERILVGDVDGDGLADIVYVGYDRVVLWINQSGNSWSDPVEITGTPAVADINAVRLVDLKGTGINGVLWSRDAVYAGEEHYFFLDFTGGAKPYLLNEMDNHMGALTRVGYKPSTDFYLDDGRNPETRWKTPLPFPVQVVAQVEVIDHFSKGKLTTEYRYHHGYWDGAEREFRGFGRVDQRDSESFNDYRGYGLHGSGVEFQDVPGDLFSPPTETRTWFHLGPVGDEFGEWEEADFSGEYWSGDPQALKRTRDTTEWLRSLPRRAKRDALRSLRGRILRTELYAQDGSLRDERPYTVTEYADGVCEVRQAVGKPKLVCEAPASAAGSEQSSRHRIFFPHNLGERTTQWERGEDPMPRFVFSGDYDRYGQPKSRTEIALPRGIRYQDALPPDSDRVRYLATHTRTDYAQRDDAGVYIVDRVARTTTYEIPKEIRDPLFELKEQAERVENNVIDIPDNIIAQTINFYDGDAFTGLGFRGLGEYGALVRAEGLILTEKMRQDTYEREVEIPILNPGAPYFAHGGARNWSAEYPEAFKEMYRHLSQTDSTRRDLTITALGYGYSQGEDDMPYVNGYYAATERRRYDFQEEQQQGARGLVTAGCDPLATNPHREDSRITTIAYETYDLLPKEVKTPGELITTAEYDQRVLQPREVTDPNGNRTQYRYTPLGLPASMAVMGDSSEKKGDTDEQPGTYFNYDFLAYENSGEDARKPVSVETLKRVEHRWQLIADYRQQYPETPPPNLSDEQIVAQLELDTGYPRDELTNHPERFIRSKEYSDGFGRLLQTRAQGEEVRFDDSSFGGAELPADQNIDPGDAKGIENKHADNPNVTISGWQVYDNKGRVVKKYEPFFSTGWSYARPDKRQQGQAVTMYCDPRGQVIRTVNPDGSEQRVVYGVPANLDHPDNYNPTPWVTYSYDANDNAGGTHKAESHAYRHHWNTPTSTTVDALGRTVETIERNRAKLDSADAPPIEEYTTSTEYDIRGNVSSITNALRREAFTYRYDLADNPLVTTSIDAGVRRMVLDAAGNEVERRDGKGALTLRAYDEINRPTELWARDKLGEDIGLREVLRYGKPGNLQDRESNRIGRLSRHYDEAGLLALEAYDFKGNLLEKVRRVIRDTEILDVFQHAQNNGWVVPAFRVDWASTNGAVEQSARSLLADKEYRTTTAYDALNRTKDLTYPESNRRQVLTPEYNRAGGLKSIRLDDGQPSVEHIAYNAKGQRILIVYGNGVMTRYAYDQLTFRLVRMRTERCSLQAAEPHWFLVTDTDAPLQDHAYRYDLAGNIVTINEKTPGSGIQGNREGVEIFPEFDGLAELLGNGNALVRNFEYDPLNRLVSATGRECATPPQDWPPMDQPRCADPTLTQPYTETYQYDRVGNIKRLSHTHRPLLDNPRTFKREFELLDGNNRLKEVTVNGTPHGYGYDDNGNMERENTERHFEWDHSDRMRVFRNQTDGAEPTTHAHYLYDAAGQRVVKLVRRQRGDYDLTVYIDGFYEHHRWKQNRAQPEERENYWLHVMDDQQRIGMRRVGQRHPKDRGPEVQYHLGDHLGSSNVVVDGNGGGIKREEYTPYGETSFGSYVRKRYRFSGKERDEESGLNYHGARHYAAWLLRWVSCDPIQEKHVLYEYVRGNPLRFWDPDGREIEAQVMTGKEKTFVTIEVNVHLTGDQSQKVTPQEVQSHLRNTWGKGNRGNADRTIWNLDRQGRQIIVRFEFNVARKQLRGGSQEIFIDSSVEQSHRTQSRINIQGNRDRDDILKHIKHEVGHSFDLPEDYNPRDTAPASGIMSSCNVRSTCETDFGNTVMGREMGEVTERNIQMIVDRLNPGQTATQEIKGVYSQEIKGVYREMTHYGVGEKLWHPSYYHMENLEQRNKLRVDWPSQYSARIENGR